MRKYFVLSLLSVAACASSFALLENATVTVKTDTPVASDPFGMAKIAVELKPFIEQEVAKLKGLGGLYVGIIMVEGEQVSDFQMARVQEGENRMEAAFANPPRIFWVDMTVTRQPNGTDDIVAGVGLTDYNDPVADARYALNTRITVGDDLIVVGGMSTEARVFLRKVQKEREAALGGGNNADAVGEASAGDSTTEIAAGLSAGDATTASVEEKRLNATTGFFFVRIEGEGDPQHRRNGRAATLVEQPKPDADGWVRRKTADGKNIMFKASGEPIDPENNPFTPRN